MKSLKFLSLFFLVLFLGTNNGFAQAEAANLTEEQKAEMAKNMEEFSEVLKLSDEQKTEFKAITKKYAMQMKAVKDGGGGKMSMYKKVKAIRKDKNAEMKELLSDDQYEAYLKKQEEMQKKMREKRS